MNYAINDYAELDGGFVQSYLLYHTIVAILATEYQRESLFFTYHCIKM